LNIIISGRLSLRRLWLSSDVSQTAEEDRTMSSFASWLFRKLGLTSPVTYVGQLKHAQTLAGMGRFGMVQSALEHCSEAILDCPQFADGYLLRAEILELFAYQTFSIWNVSFSYRGHRFDYSNGGRVAEHEREMLLKWAKEDREMAQSRSPVESGLIRP
jgi:hypothetical protein